MDNVADKLPLYHSLMYFFIKLNALDCGTPYFAWLKIRMVKVKLQRIIFIRFLQIQGLCHQLYHFYLSVLFILTEDCLVHIWK